MSSRGQPAPSPPLAGWIPATRRTTAPTSRDPVRVLPRSASDDFSRVGSPWGWLRRAPTDPDVRISGILLFRLGLCCVAVHAVGNDRRHERIVIGSGW